MVIGIIQARMGSRRLAGKVLMEIEGRPILWHIIKRLGYSKFLNKVVIATSRSLQDDAIVNFCEKNNLAFYRGSENDVLDRYYQAARAYDARAIVRICADCPLIDPLVTDRVISAYLENIDRIVGASNAIRHTYPRGLDTEVFSFDALKECWEQAKEDYQREHVTVYFYENPDLFKLYSVENNQNLSHLRWTVDEKEDLTFVREIYKRLFREGTIFLMDDILNILAKEPQLKEINEGIKQTVIVRKNSYSGPEAKI